MSRRSSATDRRREIVETALRLLGTTPLSELTTRRIAREIGVSQPALFRHFRSRGQLLLAVVEHARVELSAVAEQVLAAESGPVGQIEALVRGLLAHVEQHPGLPRLLFSDAPQADEALAAALRQLLAMQIRLAAELVRQGQRAGLLDDEVDPRAGAALLVALLQGVILQWQRNALPVPLGEMAAPLLALWLDGARDRGTAENSETKASERADPGPGDGLLALDVRPILAAGDDPLDVILETLERTGEDGLLLLTAPFRPAPVVTLVSSRGWTVEAEQVASRHWEVELRGPDSPLLDDLRDLPAPEPLERALLATAQLSPGASYLARVPRYPRLLLPHLEERRLVFRVAERHDGSALLHVRKPG